MKKSNLVKKCLCITMIASLLIPSSNLAFAAMVPEKDSDKYSVSDSGKTQNKWWKKIEAESAAKSGTVKFDKPVNLSPSGTLARYIGNGSTNSLAITVNTNFSDTVKMKIRYVSGENRNLCYKVNDGKEVKLTNLNSGSWNTLKDSDEFSIQLKQGQNKIKFYLSNGNAPDIDYITLSRNGGTEADVKNKKEVTIKFMANNTQVGHSFVKKLNETVTSDKVPEDPTKAGKDFLGWYWGPGLKYKAIFPLNLSEVPQKILNDLDGELTFTARFGKNFPENSVNKTGYRLIFDEEFNGTKLDKTKWVDKYLSSWSTEAKNTKEWTVKDGKMHLQIKPTTQPWCPEFDGSTVVSGFATGQRNGLHNWSRKNQVRNPADTELTHINQYGYYEIRAKTQPGSSRHCAWWLLGFQDVQQESAEIDIFEILGNNNHAVNSALHEWNDDDAFRNADFGLGAYTNSSKDFNNEYHVYGFDWQKGTGKGNLPDKIIFYVDGVKSKEENVNIDYPMIQLFSLYEKRKGGWTGPWEWMPYPNSFDIDYVRVYKKLPNGQKELPKDQLKVVDVKAENLTLKEDQIALKKYGDYTEKNLPGTKSYVRVYWNDGIETQEPVQWEPITEKDLETLRSGKGIVKKGRVASIGREVEMNITVAEKAPYSMNNLNPLSPNGLSYVFDGLINEPNAKSGEFEFAKNIKDENVYLEYDFKKDVDLSGVDIWTNFGSSQGIKKAKISTWNQATKSWEFVKDKDNNDKVYNLNWKTQEEAAEKVTLNIPKTTTTKVRIHILDANTKWSNKFSVREIAFNKAEVQPVLDVLELTSPTKTEYKVGEKLDLSGMTAKAKYSNGTKVNVTNEVVISNVDMSTAGEKVVTVKFKNKTATFNIIVKKDETKKPIEPEKQSNPNNKPNNTANPADKPSITTKPSQKTINSGLVQTGDEFPISGMLALLTASLTSVIIFVKKRFN